MAGLEPGLPGYKHILVKPQPGGSLTWARASLASHYGKIAVSWRLEDETLKLEVTIPPNTTATLTLPEGYRLEEGEKKELEAGNQTFVARQESKFF